MTDTSPIKATLKADGGYDAPWITVDATDPSDLAMKLKGLAEAGAFQALADASATLKAVYNVQIVPAPGPEQPQAAPAQPVSNGWGQQQAAPVQTYQPAPAAPQQQGGNKYGGRPHPTGQACDMCGKVLEYKETSTGKGVFRCPEWRWNNGTPNGHGQEWA